MHVRVEEDDDVLIVRFTVDKIVAETEVQTAGKNVPASITNRILVAARVARRGLVGALTTVFFSTLILPSSTDS